MRCEQRIGVGARIALDPLLGGWSHVSCPSEAFTDGDIGEMTRKLDSPLMGALAERQLTTLQAVKSGRSSTSLARPGADMNMGDNLTDDQLERWCLVTHGMSVTAKYGGMNRALREFIKEQVLETNYKPPGDTPRLYGERDEIRQAAWGDAPNAAILPG